MDVVIDPLRKETISLTLPLAFRRPPEEVRSELGLPPSVDLSDPIVARAVGLAGAAARHDPPIHLAFFGGTAHRLTCPSSNDAALGLRHALHDLDVAILLKEARAVREFLASVRETAGSALSFFETSGDRIFNSLSGGQRLRWHLAVDQSGRNLTLGTLDLVADWFQFCHRFDVRPDVEHGAAHSWALAPVHLLLAKGQFIQRIPREESAAVADRVLEPFGKREVVIGPEPKDLRDLLALLLDHPVEESVVGISPSAFRSALSSDWGLWKTVGLNLGLLARSPILLGLPPAARATIGPRLEELRRIVTGCAPKRRLGFLGGPWWEEVDSTPPTDATVPLG